MKLNGWKRIGIIVSIVWVIGAGAHTYNSTIDKFSEMIASTHVQCDNNLAAKTGDAYTVGFNACNKEADDSLTSVLGVARLDAVLVALVPVPLGWGFAYLILFLIGWVKRGFLHSGVQHP